MKTKNLFLSIVCVMIMSVTLVAQIPAATICLDDTASCNDIKLIIPVVSEGNAYNIAGYEYGCGYNNKEIYGTLRVKNNLWYINITKNGVYNGEAMTSPSVIVYDPAKNTGSYDSIIIYSSDSWDVSGKYKKVTCGSSSSAVSQAVSGLQAIDNDVRR
jgi:hypothetical protein